MCLMNRSRMPTYSCQRCLVCAFAKFGDSIPLSMLQRTVQFLLLWERVRVDNLGRRIGLETPTKTLHNRIPPPTTPMIPPPTPPHA